jgi:hypothetical protein
MKMAVRALADLGEDVVLAPERHVASERIGGGTPLGDLVVERAERALPSDLRGAVVVDTTHARDGVLDVAAALRAAPEARSAKKLARAGDLVVSRLRPYLRQIAVVRPAVVALAARRPLAVSTEFYVLRSPEPGEDLAWLLPFLLGDHAQSILAAAQEGGHHPRVPRASLLALRVPKNLVRRRIEIAQRVGAALDRVYAAAASYRAVLDAKPVDD